MNTAMKNRIRNLLADRSAALAAFDLTNADADAREIGRLDAILNRLADQMGLVTEQMIGMVG